MLLLHHHGYESALTVMQEAWSLDEVICPSCHYAWAASRTLATEIRLLMCPLCSQAGTELLDEYNVAELTRQ